MLKCPNFTAPALAMALCAGVGATALAMPLEKVPANLVAPKAASLKIKNINCPGSADIRVVVWSKNPGLVKFELELKGVGIVTTGAVKVSTAAKGGYKGFRSANIALVSAPSKNKYRLVATGNGKTRKTNWVTTKSCKLSL